MASQGIVIDLTAGLASPQRPESPDYCAMDDSSGADDAADAEFDAYVIRSMLDNDPLLAPMYFGSSSDRDAAAPVATKPPDAEFRRTHEDPRDQVVVVPVPVAQAASRRYGQAQRITIVDSNAHMDSDDNGSDAVGGIPELSMVVSQQDKMEVRAQEELYLAKFEQHLDSSPQARHEMRERYLKSLASSNMVVPDTLPKAAWGRPSDPLPPIHKNLLRDPAKCGFPCYHTGLPLKFLPQLISRSRTLFLHVPGELLNSTEHRVGQICKGYGEVGEATQVIWEILTALCSSALSPLGLPSDYDAREHQNGPGGNGGGGADAPGGGGGNMVPDAAILAALADDDDLKDPSLNDEERLRLRKEKMELAMFQARCRQESHMQQGLDFPLAVRRGEKDKLPPVPGRWKHDGIGWVVPHALALLEPVLLKDPREGGADDARAYSSPNPHSVTYMFAALNPEFSWELGIRQLIEMIASIRGMASGGGGGAIRARSDQDAKRKEAARALVLRLEAKGLRVPWQAVDWALMLRTYLRQADPDEVCKFNFMAATARSELYSPIDDVWSASGVSGATGAILSLRNAITQRWPREGTNGVSVNAVDLDKAQAMTGIHPRQLSYWGYFYTRLPDPSGAVQALETAAEREVRIACAHRDGQLRDEVAWAFVQPYTGAWDIARVERLYLPFWVPEDVRQRYESDGALAEEALHWMSEVGNNATGELSATMAADPQAEARKRWNLKQLADRVAESKHVAQGRLVALKTDLKAAEEKHDAVEVERIGNDIEQWFVDQRNSDLEHLQKMMSCLGDTASGCRGGLNVHDHWSAMLNTWAPNAPEKLRRNGTHYTPLLDPEQSFVQNFLQRRMYYYDKMARAYNSHLNLFRSDVARVMAYDMTDGDERIWFYLDGDSGAGKSFILNFMRATTISSEICQRYTPGTFTSDTNFSLMLRMMTEADLFMTGRDSEMTSGPLKECMTSGQVGTQAFHQVKNSPERRTHASGMIAQCSWMMAGQPAFNDMAADLQTRCYPLYCSMRTQHPEAPDFVIKNTAVPVDMDNIRRFEEELRDENMWCALFMIMKGCNIGNCEWDLRVADHAIDSLNYVAQKRTGGRFSVCARDKKFLIRAMKSVQLIVAVHEVFNGPPALFNCLPYFKPSLNWLFLLEPYALAICEEVAWFTLSLFADIILNLRQGRLLAFLAAVTGVPKPRNMDDVNCERRRALEIKERREILKKVQDQTLALSYNSRRPDLPQQVQGADGKMRMPSDMSPEMIVYKAQLAEYNQIQALLVTQRAELDQLGAEAKVLNEYLNGADSPKFMAPAGGSHEMRNFHYVHSPRSLKDCIRQLSVDLGDEWTEQEIAHLLTPTSSGAATGHGGGGGFGGGGFGSSGEQRIKTPYPARMRDDFTGFYVPDDETGLPRWTMMSPILVTRVPGFFFLVDLFVENEAYSNLLTEALNYSCYVGIRSRPYMVAMGRPYYDAETDTEWPNVLRTWNVPDSDRVLAYQNPYAMDMRAIQLVYQNHLTKFAQNTSNNGTSRVITSSLELECYRSVWANSMSPRTLAKYNSAPLWWVGISIFKEHYTDPQSIFYKQLHQARYVGENYTAEFYTNPSTKKRDLSEWFVYYVRLSRDTNAANRLSMDAGGAAFKAILHQRFQELEDSGLAITRSDIANFVRNQKTLEAQALAAISEADRARMHSLAYSTPNVYLASLMAATTAAEQNKIIVAVASGNGMLAQKDMVTTFSNTAMHGCALVATHGNLPSVESQASSLFTDSFYASIIIPKARNIPGGAPPKPKRRVRVRERKRQIVAVAAVPAAGVVRSVIPSPPVVAQKVGDGDDGDDLADPNPYQ